LADVAEGLNGSHRVSPITPGELFSSNSNAPSSEAHSFQYGTEDQTRKTAQSGYQTGCEQNPKKKEWVGRVLDEEAVLS
jgi:hypothetical protein